MTSPLAEGKDDVLLGVDKEGRQFVHSNLWCQNCGTFWEADHPARHTTFQCPVCFKLSGVKTDKEN